MTFLKYLLFSIGVAISSLSLASSLDSLKLEVREDGTYIIHRVASGETLFSLSKRYKSDLAQIAAVNKLDGYSINIGQILEIPHDEKTPAVKSTNETVHIVKKGETLYAISHVYGVNIYDLKSWNSLASNSISEGQELLVSGISSATNTARPIKQASNVNIAKGDTHIVKSGETLFSISQKYGLTVTQLMSFNEIEDSSLSVGQSLIVSDKKLVAVANNSGQEDVRIADPISTTEAMVLKEEPIPEIEIDSVEAAPVRRKRFGNSDVKKDGGEFKKIFEEGIAMRIDNSPKTKKYLCLHRTLPIGAIIQVRNLMNNQSIFVRVVGALPDTGNNQKVLIRLSDIAYQRLGALDAKFPVEVSYIPE